MEPSGGESAEEGRRALTCLIMSREVGKKKFTNPEGECKVKRVDLSKTAEATFQQLAPQLVSNHSRVKDMELEEVGLVPPEGVPVMRRSDYDGATIIENEDGLLDEEPLRCHMGPCTRGLLFRVLFRGGPSSGQQPQHEQQHQQQQEGGGEPDDGARGGGSALAPKQRQNPLTMLMQSQQLTHRPALKEATRTGKPVRLGFPSQELAYNDAIRCLEKFGIGFTSDEADKAGKKTVETLRNTAFYLCSHVKTISERKHSLLSVLAELGFFFIPVDDARAQAIVSCEDRPKFADVLDNGRFKIRVGLGEGGSPEPLREFYLYRYYTHITSHPKRELIGGKVEHAAEVDGRITGTSLAKLAEDLWQNILNQPWARVTAKSAPGKRRLIYLIGALARQLDEYDQYLELQSEARAGSHAATEEELAEKAISNRLIKHEIGYSSILDKDFMPLARVLRDKREFEPVPVADFFAPAVDRNALRRNRRFVEKLLKHGVPYRLAYCKLGGSDGDARVTEFIWRVPRVGDKKDAAAVDLTSDGEEDEESLAAAVVEEAAVWTKEMIIDRNHMTMCLVDTDPARRRQASRRVLNEARARLLPLVAGIPSSTFSFLFEEMTGLSCPTNHGGVDKDRLERLRAVVRRGDPDIIVDYRTLNGSQGKCFDLFFDVAAGKIEELGAPRAHERRHGASVASISINIRDLYDQCVDAFKARKEEIGEDAADELFPSESYFYDQFLPTHTRYAASTRSTGRFELALKVLERTARAEHPDEHYCAAQRRYLQHFAVEHRELATFVSLDDKNNMVVGDPNKPVAVLERGRRVLVAHGRVPEKGGAVQAMDHDAGSGTLKIVPTVVLVVDVPESVDGAWMRGHVFTTLKDAVFEQSSWLRSPAELLSVMEAALDGEHGEELQAKVSFTDASGRSALRPILIGLTDGGSEHRTTFASVQLGLVCLFRKADFDYVVFIRTCPGQSYMNFVERVMAIINIGCSGVAIMRDALVGETEDGVPYEKILKGCKSMKEVREKAAKHPGLQAAVGKACERVKALLMDRCGRMSLKGNGFRSGATASEADMDDLWRVILEIDANFTREDTTKQEMKLREDFQEFMRTHVEVRLYSITISKQCQNGGAKPCRFGCRLRMPQGVFDELPASFYTPSKASPSSTSYIPYKDAVKAGTCDESSWCPSLVEKGKVAAKLSKMARRQQSSSGEEATSGTSLDLACRSWKGKKEKDWVKAGNAKLMLPCTECHKPRVVYVDPTLPLEDAKKLLERVGEGGQYQCGDCDLFVVGHKTVVYPAAAAGVAREATGADAGGRAGEEHEEEEEAGEVDVEARLVAVEGMTAKTKIDCASPMEKDFFMKQLGGAETMQICWYCGEDAPPPPPEGTEGRPLGWNHVWPRCEGCEGKGLAYGTFQRKTVASQAAEKQRLEKRAAATETVQQNQPPPKRSRKASQAQQKKRAGKATSSGLSSSDSSSDEEDELESADARQQQETAAWQQPDGPKGQQQEEAAAAAARAAEEARQQEEAAAAAARQQQEEAAAAAARAAEEARLQQEAAAEGAGQQQLFCWCQTVYDENTSGDMAECEGCGEWYHFACIKEKKGAEEEEMVKNLKAAQAWYCKRACKAAKTKKARR